MPIHRLSLTLIDGGLDDLVSALHVKIDILESLAQKDLIVKLKLIVPK